MRILLSYGETVQRLWGICALSLLRVVASDDGALVCVFPRLEQILIVEGMQLVPHCEVGCAAHQCDDAEDVGCGIAGAEAVQHGQHAQQDTRQEQQQAVMLQGNSSGGIESCRFPVAMPADTFQTASADEVRHQTAGQDIKGKYDEQQSEDTSSPVLPDVVAQVVNGELFPDEDVEN